MHSDIYVVPEVLLTDQGLPDYSRLVNHRPGQLYAVRTASNTVELRTLNSSEMTPFGQANIGVQDAAKGVYLCVAINGEKTNTTMVTINPTGEKLFVCLHGNTSMGI